ncbi:MarP family serine protease [uncultured Pseudokineococcus sp.]|uniref:MarP family serine protease n=1 Tax=uncultured Pseudokineococcus sp. TaxID=1642928 RepID=UPI002639CF77|nr:MarP family serine protease [uncultured Pseudokineococcus sp.]
MSGLLAAAGDLAGVGGDLATAVGDGGVVVDVLVVLLAVTYALSGFRRGVVLGVLSLAGFLGAGALAAALLPDALAGWEPPWQRVVLVLGGVLVAALLGQALLVAVGSRLRALVSWQPLRVLDGLLGAVMSLLIVAALVWFAAGALRAAPAPVVSRAVEDSRIASALERAVPVDAGSVFTELGSALRAEGFPRVFTGSEEPIAPVEAPDPAASSAARAVADGARGSVVKVTGLAEECARGVEGTGFVVAPGRVVTNAHVVAGVASPSVQVAGEGRRLPAGVVVYDPQRDLAVLDVPDLGAPALPLGGVLAPGEAGAVVGFPLDGPYDVEAARVRQVVTALGEDVYGEPGVTREVYSLRADVQPGNSGGPLLDLDGRVVGVVFARSVDDPSTGYALTLAESREVLDVAATATGAVSTQECVAA